MYCPSCSTFLLEGQLIKTNVKKFHDTEVEYDARCPFCQVRIGRMFWGRLEVAEGLVSYNIFSHQEQVPLPQEPPRQSVHHVPEEEEPYCELEDDGQAARQIEPQPDASFQKYSYYQEPPPSYYYCPYCGHKLPEEKHKLPYKSGFGEDA